MAWRRETVRRFDMGYEGQSLESFVDALVAVGFTALVDVRLNALSRKPGFSKRSLGEALAYCGLHPATSRHMQIRSAVVFGHILSPRFRGDYRTGA